MTTTHDLSGGGPSEVAAPGDHPTRAAAITAAGNALAESVLACQQMTPREQAEAAHTPGGKSVEQLEAEIRAERGLPARQHAEAS